MKLLQWNGDCSCAYGTVCAHVCDILSWSTLEMLLPCAVPSSRLPEEALGLQNYPRDGRTCCVVFPASP
jgi:hypothetical protein